MDAKEKGGCSCERKDEWRTMKVEDMENMLDTKDEIKVEIKDEIKDEINEEVMVEDVKAGMEQEV